MDALSRLLRSPSDFDQYANFSTFLCATTLQIISTCHEPDYAERWNGLNSVLDQWYERRPRQMQPVFTSFEKGHDTFPIIVFSNPPAISGNQMYHAASLLMLQSKPKHAKPRGSKSMFWHARHIVGISATNRNQSVPR